jgi:two-component system, NarL family, response regulator LiaR
MPDTKPIRVLLVDDHTVVRKGLKAFLLSYADLELVGEASSGAEAIRQCQQHYPDVILMDLVMPGMDGATATQEIRALCPQTQVVVLTSFPEEDLVEKALKAGAISYLLKNIEADELAQSIRDAHRGRSTLSPEAAQALIHVHTRSPKPGDDLTRREREVLQKMVNGMTNREIAGNLDVSSSTVKFHVSNILSKLGVESRTEAVAYALQHGLVKAQSEE